MSKALQKVSGQPIIKTDPVDDFLRLIHAGIDAWRKAGELLSALVNTDEHIFSKITTRVPWLTADILWGFKRIGERKLCPYLLLDSSTGSRRLSQLPYEVQVRVYDMKSVSVAYKMTDGSYGYRDMSLQLLTSSEADLLFDREDIRSVEAQIEVLKRGSLVRPRRNTETGRSLFTSDPESEVIKADELNATPIEELKKHLEMAQAALIASRTDISLMKAKLDSNLDNFISVALKAIGELRFKVSHPNENS